MSANQNLSYKQPEDLLLGRLEALQVYNELTILVTTFSFGSGKCLIRNWIVILWNSL